MPNHNDYREQHKQELIASDIAPNELQMRYRNTSSPVTKRNSHEQECAVIDALVEQGGIAAWHGDGVGCVAQMIDAQMVRAEKAEEALKQILKAAEQARGEGNHRLLTIIRSIAKKGLNDYA